jgi:hypothetical protein
VDTKNLTAPSTTREQRGLALYREHGHEVEHLGGHRLSVPSCTGTHRYLVDLKAETCSCDDAIHAARRCKHLYAASLAHAKSATCSGCGDRVPRRGLIEVTEDHQSLTFFEGDHVCEDCALGAGVAL